jgi:hypothetical protein
MPDVDSSWEYIYAFFVVVVRKREIFVVRRSLKFQNIGFRSRKPIFSYGQSPNTEPEGTIRKSQHPIKTEGNPPKGSQVLCGKNTAGLAVLR